MEVEKEDVKKIERELLILKTNLRKLLNPDILQVHKDLITSEKEVHNLTKKLTDVENERDHWKARYEAAQAEVEREKMAKFEAKKELNELGEQLSEQSEYCASMGAACSTLLWRVSRCEDSIQAILVGSKVDDFLKLVGTTIESYLNTFEDEDPSDTSEETQFVLALVGIITNIAATDFGRHFLMKIQTGREVFSSFISSLKQAPNQKYRKIKNLILMSLFNVTLNKMGLKFMCEQQGLVEWLVTLLEEETDTENRIHTLRLLQSLLYSEYTPVLQAIALKLKQPLLQKLSQSSSSEIRELAAELATDMNTICNEH